MSFGSFGTSGGFGGIKPTTTTGFGAPATAGGGFGSTSFGGSGGFGVTALQPTSSVDPYFYHVPSLSEQSKCTGAGRYLMEIENAYNAMHPNCKFRAFLYNMCEEGRGATVIRGEIHKGQLLGGGAKESQWIIAKKENPDSERMVPKPVHFMNSLTKRTVKQQEMAILLHRHLDRVAQKLDTLQQLNEENAAMHRHLVKHSAMVESNILSAMAGSEGLRQRGLQLGDEKHVIGDRAAYLLNTLRSPGMFKAALREVQPYVEAATYARTRLAAEPSTVTDTCVDVARPIGSSGGGNIPKGLMDSRRLGGGIDVSVLADWTKFLGEMDVAIAKLRETVEKDYLDMKKVKEHIGQHQGNVRS